MRSLFSKHARHPTTPPPPVAEAPPRRRFPKENVDPSSPHPHPHAADHASPYRSPSSAAKPLATRNRSLPPRPPSSNPLKRKLDVSPARAAAAPAPEPAPASSDSGVQVGFPTRLGLARRQIWLT
jgi:kinesin family protein 15